MELAFETRRGKFPVDEGWIQREMDYWRVPGIAIGIVKEGEEPQTLCRGYRDIEKKLPFNEDTLFCVASCSKSMTAALLARLTDEGVLDLDTPVKEIVPKFKLWDEVASKETTLRDLLCHRTGLGGYDTLWPGRENRAWLAERLAYLEPTFPFRKKAQYSNVLYAVAGYVAEYITGTPWEALMETYIFWPLGMSRTCCSGSRMIADFNHAEPYYVRNGAQQKVPFWNVDQAGPAASVNTTLTDMIRWLQFHIRGGKTADGTPLLRETLFQQLHRPHIKYEDGAGLPDNCFPADHYCLGWLSGRYRGREMQKHSGKIEGYSTLQAYLPEEKIGVVIMANLHSPSTPIFYTICYTVFDLLLGFHDRDWAAEFHPGGEQAPVEAYLDCDKDYASRRLTADLEKKPRSFDLPSYAGCYWNPGFGYVVVEAKEKGLWLHYRDQTLPLRHWGENQFWMDGVKEDVLTIRVPVIFERRNDGITAVKIGYEERLENIRFIRETPV